MAVARPSSRNLAGTKSVRGAGAKPSQPSEAGSLSSIGAMYRLGRRSGVWLFGDPYADLALGAIREREQMALLEDEPRYGDNEARPPESATTAGAAQNDPPPRPPDRATPRIVIGWVGLGLLTIGVLLLVRFAAWNAEPSGVS